MDLINSLSFKTALKNLLQKYHQDDNKELQIYIYTYKDCQTIIVKESKDGNFIGSVRSDYLHDNKTESHKNRHTVIF